MDIGGGGALEPGVVSSPPIPLTLRSTPYSVHETDPKKNQNGSTSYSGLDSLDCGQRCLCAQIPEH
jgi:hypothetical protein